MYRNHACNLRSRQTEFVHPQLRAWLACQQKKTQLLNKNKLIETVLAITGNFVDEIYVQLVTFNTPK